MSNRIDRLEARVQAFECPDRARGVADRDRKRFPAHDGEPVQRRRWYAAMPIWKNPEALNLRAARQLLAAVPSAVK